MEKVICDTDVMIDYLDKRRSRHIDTVNAINIIGSDNLTISAITKMELIAGIENKAELRSLKNNIDLFTTLHLNQQITLIALELMETYKLSHGLEIPDALMATSSKFSPMSPKVIIDASKILSGNARGTKVVDI